MSSAGANAETVEKARLFGEKVGIAFQIKTTFLTMEMLK
jgi:octaprenyl-diphosphate synthase